MKVIGVVAILIGAGILGSCSLRLGLDILNATDGDISVTVGNQRQSIEPGLWFRGKWPREGEGKTVRVDSGACFRLYSLPDLGQTPWRFLFGESAKFRLMPSGILQGYPPTPDVEQRGNPERAMTEDKARIRPIQSTCR